MQRLITKLHLERYLSSKLILCIDLAISVMASLVALIIVHLLFGGGHLEPFRPDMAGRSDSVLAAAVLCTENIPLYHPPLHAA